MESWEGDVRRLHSSLAGLVGVIVMTAACGGGSNPPPAGNTGTAAPSASAPGNVSTDKNSYPVFTNPDAGADPAVTAEQGGKGFKGEGWETNTNFDLLGDPKAIKGGVFREYQSYFPGTFRIYGPESNLAAFSLIQNLTYETFCRSIRAPSNIFRRWRRIGRSRPTSSRIDTESIRTRVSPMGRL